MGLLPPQGDRCLERLRTAGKRREKVIVYGDTDIDGCMGTAIMMRALTLIGAHPIPAFGVGNPAAGPGVRWESLEPGLHEGASLVLTVDCAVRDPEIERKLLEKGVDLWMTDHHPYPPNICAPAVNCCEEGAHFPSLCGAGISLRLALHLFPKESPSSTTDDALAVAMLATLGDAVPLVGENRSIVLLGVEALARTEHSGLLSLRPNTVSISEEGLLALRRKMIAPLNAAPRFGDVESPLSFFLESDPPAHSATSQRLIAHNRRRQRRMKSLLTRIGTPKKPKEGRIGLFFSPQLPAEFVSQVAGRLVFQMGVPFIAFGRASKGLLRGSCRSLDGLPLRDSAIEALGSLAIDIGGHPLAFGITVKESDWNEVEKRLSPLSPSVPPPMERGLEVPFLPPSEILVVQESLGPFGPGFRRPYYSLEGARVIEGGKALLWRGESHPLVLRGSDDEVPLMGRLIPRGSQLQIYAVPSP
ncbi:hypothetical protein H8D30_01105 [bacterium]|nr:hypothetical protein [bacterium]